MPRKLARILVLTVTLATLGILANAPPAMAYGSNTQWQIGFAGTFHSSSGVSGFWGWCAFGGTNSATTGTTADCQIENYFFTTQLGAPLNPFHVSMDGTGWLIATGSGFLPTDVPGFFFTGGTAELTGPGAEIIHQLFGVPVGVVFPLSDACNFSNVPASLKNSPCDTGIPAIPGHFNLNGPGIELQVQVTRIG